MRGLWSTAGLVVVLAGLGAYIYFVTWKTPETDAGPKKEKVFAALQADKIDELKVSTAAGDVTTLKKEGGAWQLTQPVAAKADESEVSGITTALTSIEVVRVVDESPANLNDYGLSNPRIEIDFKASGDKDYRKLLVGEKTPTGGDLFAKRNDEKKIFLIPAFQETTLNRRTFDLREKVLLKFDREKVDSFDVSAGGKTLAVAKEGGEWKITKPVQTRADFGTVEGLVGRLQTVQMKSIVTDEAKPADLRQYGLDKPDATVNLNVGSARATLLLGGKAPDNTVYARDASKPAVVTVEGALLDELKKGADDYRRKDLFEFRAFNANRVEVLRNGQTVVFEKVKGQGDNAKDKIDSLLSKLSNTRASSFVDSSAKTGLDKPAMTITVKFEEGKKEEKVTFGQVGNDVFASRPGEPGAAKTDATDFNDAIKSLDELSK